MLWTIEAAAKTNGARRAFEVEAISKPQARIAAIPMLHEGEQIRSISKTVSGSSRIASLSADEVSEFCYNLSELCGVTPFEGALDILLQAETRNNVRDLLARMKARAIREVSIASNFEAEAEFLGPTCVAFARQADGGEFPRSMAAAGSVIERHASQRDNVLAAVTGPLLFFAMIACLFTMNVFLVYPKLLAEPAAGRSPAVSIVLTIDAFAKGTSLVWLPTLIGIFLFFAFGFNRQESIAYYAFRMWPRGRRALSLSTSADLAFLLGTSLTNQISTRVALEIAAVRYRDLPIGKEIARAAADPRSERSLAQVLREHTSVDSSLITAAFIAETTRDVGRHLTEFAGRLYTNADRAFALFTRRIYTWMVAMALAALAFALLAMLSVSR